MPETKDVLLPPRRRNLNAQIERYMRSLKSECLDRMGVFALTTNSPVPVELPSNRRGTRSAFRAAFGYTMFMNNLLLSFPRASVPSMFSFMHPSLTPLNLVLTMLGF